MQDSVFDAADILVDVHPVVGFLRIPGFFIIAGIGVAEIVPRRADKGIDGIRFTRSQRRYGTGCEFDVFRQLDRQLVFRYELFAAFRAVDDRNRSAPIALTGNEPVAQTIVDAAFS